MNLSKEQRHNIMASIHSSGTKPELLVRQYLFSRGFRYRLNYRQLPGCPDIVLRKYRTCIFVNGCFWHGHNCIEFRKAKSNVEYWNIKIEKNKCHDKEVQEKLAIMGWHCITVWECELKKDKVKRTLEALAFTLNHIFLQDHSVSYNPIIEDNKNMAAEDRIY